MARATGRPAVPELDVRLARHAGKAAVEVAAADSEHVPGAELDRTERCAPACQARLGDHGHDCDECDRSESLTMRMPGPRSGFVRRDAGTEPVLRWVDITDNPTMTGTVADFEMTVSGGEAEDRVPPTLFEPHRAVRAR